MSRWARSCSFPIPGWHRGPARWTALRGAAFLTIALTPGPDAVDLASVSIGAGDRVAVLLGAEGPGLSGPALAAVDIRARIPLRAGVDSLNVGHAAAIAFHHIDQCRR